jgi:hypothetical protein
MVDHLKLAEAPAIVVEKKGKRFEIGEVPALDLITVQEACSSMRRDDFEAAIKALFIKGADEAMKVFTFRDIGQIVNAIVKRDVVPLAEESTMTENAPSPSENVS